jgi:hypothetical protein
MPMVAAHGLASTRAVRSTDLPAIVTIRLMPQWLQIYTPNTTRERHVE